MVRNRSSSVLTLLNSNYHHHHHHQSYSCCSRITSFSSIHKPSTSSSSLLLSSSPLSSFFTVLPRSNFSTTTTTTTSSSSSTTNVTILNDKFGQYVQRTYGLIIKKLPVDPVTKQSNGRGLFSPAHRTLPKDHIVLYDTPLVSVIDSQQLDTTCATCFRALSSSSSSSSSVITCSCGVHYCSSVCQKKAIEQGHDALCNSQYTLLNQWCKEMRINYPRVAAATVAKSISSSVTDFSDYWTSINRLASITLSMSTDTYPKVWTNGYRLVCEALKTNMKGDVSGFFEYAFNLQAYARFIGTLRLNSFSIPCPIDQLSSSSSSSSVVNTLPIQSARTIDNYSTNLLAPSVSNEGSSDGCCGTTNESMDSQTGTISTSSSACDSSSSSCSSGNNSSATYEAPGGTGLYAVASFINHSCDPNLDVILSPYGEIGFRTRRSIPPDTELNITYLDSSTPVQIRRVQLYHSYGFECQCSLCTEQLQTINEIEKRSKGKK